MRSKQRTLARFLACAFVLGALPSHAAGEGVWCLMAFGTESPAEWCVEPHAGRITAISQPFASAWSRGTLFVRGTATPGRQIRVEVTDGMFTVGKTVTSSLAADPSAGEPAGSFNAEIQVAELGSHAAAPGEPRTLYGAASTLTVTAFPGTENDPTGRARSVEVTKFAGTPNDVYPPSIGTVKWPPSAWHPKSAALSQSSTDGIVRGVATDDPPSSVGRASEIADITVTVRKGSTILWRPDPGVFRSTTVKGHWNLLLKVGQFAPNWLPGEQKYFIDVVVIDAWGNRSTVTSPGITVYPF